jgi:RNA polymerase sigma-70 factor (ECF subfamily)
VNILAEEAEPWVEDLLARHGAWLRRVVRRRMADPALIDDAVQETFLRVFRSSPPTDDDELRRWLAVVARRACADVWRAQPRRAAALDDDLPVLRAEFPGSDEHVAGLARRARIDDALVRLPPRHRRLLQKQAVLDLSYDEIAAQERVSVASVTSALSRARAGFRRRYGDRETTEAPLWLVPFHRLAERVRARVDAVTGSHAAEWAAASVTLGMAAVLIAEPATSAEDLVPVLAAEPRAPAERPPFGPTGRDEAGPASAVPGPEARGPASDGRSTATPTAATPSPSPMPLGSVATEPLHVDLRPEQWTVQQTIEVEGPGGTARFRSETTFYCDRSRVGAALCPIAEQLPGARSSR